MLDEDAIHQVRVALAVVVVTAPGFLDVLEGFDLRAHPKLRGDLFIETVNVSIEGVADRHQASQDVDERPLTCAVRTTTAVPKRRADDLPIITHAAILIPL